MATRYFVGGYATGLSLPDTGQWNDYQLQDGDSPLMAVTTKEATPYNENIVQEVSATSGWTNCILTLITAQLGAQTLSGTVKAQWAAWETNAAANQFLRIGIYVYDSTLATKKATLLAPTDDGVEVSSTTRQNRTVLSGASLSSFACDNNDRVVIEVGVKSNNTKTTPYNCYLRIYDAAGATELPEDDTTDGSSGYCGWVEFSQTHAAPSNPITVIPPTATITMTPQTPRPVRDVPVAAITMTTLVPTYAASGVMMVYLPVASMALTGLNPTYDDHVDVIPVPAASIALSGLAPDYDLGSTEIRQEINMLCHVLSATSGNAATSDEIVQLNDDYYPDGTFYFEIVGYTSASLAVDITLRRKGTSTDDATCSIPADTTAARVFRSSSFTPPTAATEYVVYVPNTSGATKYVVSARIVIIQKARPLYRTEVQIEIGNYETGKNNITTPAALAYPKYWKMDWTARDAAGWAYAEVVYKVSSASGAVTIYLQEDDGAFGTWKNKLKIVDAGTATTPTRVRADGPMTEAAESKLYLRQDKHYRIAACLSSASYTYDIYSAKIIYRQGVWGLRKLPEWDTYSCLSIAMSIDGQRILAATSQQRNPDTGADANCGVYSSVNGGDTFTALTTGYYPRIVAMSDDGKYKYAADENYIYTSSDYGTTWTTHTELTEMNGVAGLACSSSGQYVYAASRQREYYSESHFWKSDDYGASFAELIEDAPQRFGTICCDDTGQYVAYGYYGGKIRVSDDYAESYTEKSPLADHTSYMKSMSRDGTHLIIMMYGADTVEHWTLSHDFGENWTELTERPSGLPNMEMAVFGPTSYILWGSFRNDSTGANGLWRSDTNGIYWTEILPNMVNARWYAAGVNSDETIVAVGVATSVYRLLVFKSPVTKTQGEYLIENTYDDSAGLADYDVKWEPADWKLPSLSLKHVIDTSADAGDSAKLQTDPNGTPVDISGSTATGANRAESSSITPPASAQTIDVNVLNAPVYASRIIARYELNLPVTPNTVTITLTPLEPTIYPMKISVPAAAMTLTELEPTWAVPPQIFAYIPTASMQLITRSVHHSWDIAGNDIATAAATYKCVLTGAADSLPDITLPLSYFEAILTDIFNSYVSCIIPDVASYEDETTSRPNGDIVIFTGYRLASGTELIEEILRVPFVDMVVSRGGRRESITITGRGVVAVGTSKERTARNVSSYIKQSDGKWKITSDVDFFLRCGDVFIYGDDGNEYVIVGIIEYEAGTTPLVSRMNVTEL